MLADTLSRLHAMRLSRVPPTFRLPAMLAVLAISCGSRSAASHAAAAPLPAAPGARSDSLRLVFARTEAETGGRLSVVAVHVESGERVEYRPDAPTFMSSVVKLPIAVQLLRRVDLGELRLADSLRLTPYDLRPGWSPLAVRHPGGTTLTVREVLRYAVSESDNSASDALAGYSGGHARVSEVLARLGARGIRVDRGYGENALAYNGVTAPRDRRWTRAAVDSAIRATPEPVRDSAARAFLADPRNTATAAAVVDLLLRVHRGPLLSDSSRALLLRFMTESANPATRIVAGLPSGTPVAHKTGTWGGWKGVDVCVNDVGIVTLPGGRGHLALAILTAGTTAPTPTVERGIADVTRALYAHWAR